MFACRRLLLVTLFAISTAALAEGRGGITLTYFEPVERLDIRSADGPGARKPGVVEPLRMSFNTLGRSYDLALEPNARLLSAIPLAARNTAVPYKGRLAGLPESWVRLVIADDAASGLIWDGTELLAIEPPGDNLANSPQLIAYRLTDVIIEPGALGCASGAASAQTGADVYKTLIDGAGQAFAVGAVEEINVGAVGDFEAFGVHGANTQTRILARLSNVDGIYSDQVGIQINVPLVEVFSDVNDPFSDESNAGNLLDEVATYRSSTAQQRAQGLTHLYTGRDLDGTTAGIAFIGTICHPSAGSGLSEIGNSSTIDSLVAAHEIGHNFGADHDGDPVGSCPNAPLTHIMAPSVSPNNDTFSACSIGVMQATAAAASCVTALPSTDISVSFADPDATVLLSNAVQVTADVRNLGTEDAVNAVADITLPANVSLAGATGATCTSGGGTVSCQLGTMAGGSAVEIIVSTDTVSVGTGSFDVTVTADADDRPTNNQDSVQLTVDPAVNLVINRPATPQVQVDQSTNVSVTIDNTSPLAATNVTLSIALNAALRANSASWSIGSCTVAAQQVDCQAAQFDAQSSSSLSLDVTGLAGGTKGYTLILASAEADADPSDNTLTGSVNVNESKKDDSGGATGWLFLVILLAISLRARHRRATQ